MRKGQVIFLCLTIAILISYLIVIQFEEYLVYSQTPETKIIKEKRDILDNTSIKQNELLNSNNIGYNSSEIKSSTKGTQQTQILSTSDTLDNGSLALDDQIELAKKIFNQLNNRISDDNKPEEEKTLSFQNFTKIIQYNEPNIIVEYQSDQSVILKANENTLLTSNGTLMPLWHAIDIVKRNGYELEIVESGIGSKGNPTKFYVILEKNN